MHIRLFSISSHYKKVTGYICPNDTWKKLFKYPIDSHQLFYLHSRWRGVKLALWAPKWGSYMWRIRAILYTGSQTFLMSEEWLGTSCQHCISIGPSKESLGRLWFRMHSQNFPDPCSLSVKILSPKLLQSGYPSLHASLCHQCMNDLIWLTFSEVSIDLKRC